MVKPIEMPVLGESVAEGTIVKWYKKEGEKIERDEMLFEVSTDKVDTEIPSPVTGIVKKILVPEGNTVPVRTEVAQIDAEGKAVSGEAAIKPELVKETTDKVTEIRLEGDAQVRSRILSPLVRKLAKENNVDLSKIQGSGTGGRITKSDVHEYIKLSASKKAEEITVPDVVEKGSRIAAGQRTEKMSNLRRVIADHMIQSSMTAVQVTNVIEVDMTNISSFRDRHKNSFKEKEGFSLSYLPMIARVTIEALKKFPVVNASLVEDQIVYHDYVNLGIAVALEDGLIVPVIKHAEEKNIVGLARAINDLAVRSRSKKLNPDDVQDGTFSITNQGVFGSMFSTPIINYPQSAILSFETIIKRPVVVNDAIAIKPMVFLPLSWDHRLMDGSIAARFLQFIKETAETWDVDQAI